MRDAGAPTSNATDGTEIRFHYSKLFPQVLEQAACSLLVSTYQAGQLVAVGATEGRLNLSFRRFEQAMGIALMGDRLVIGGKGEVWTLREHADIASAIEPSGRYDQCWLPHTSIVTGEIQCHEICWGTTMGPHRATSAEQASEDQAVAEPDLWIVNTRFSCLAGIDPRYNFVPRWRPPFISELVAQDRCHLNGLAMREGSPAFVTVMALSNEPRGWRAARNNSGAILDVASGEVVTTGLAMPHSPRWHNGNLFVLNSGMGRLELVDRATGQREPVAAIPGYARGLAIHAGLAFVGLSKIRETAIFGGAPIAEYHDQLKCGVGIIDLEHGDTVATLQFANGVEEIFDVQLAHGTRCPALGGPPGDDEIWLLPG